jgi:UDPglucose 6-dehydrogenase
MREAPSVTIIEGLLEAGSKVKVYDPAAMNECMKHFGNRVGYGKDQYEPLLEADALIIVTEWSEFRLPDFVQMAKSLKNKLIFDGRNIYNPSEMKELGYCYYSIGHQSI